jgi:hypothetical protein
MRLIQLQSMPKTKKNSRNGTAGTGQPRSRCTPSDWQVLSILPLAFCANVFYSYQQNIVNGMTSNIRTPSPNSSLYWIA